MPVRETPPTLDVDVQPLIPLHSILSSHSFRNGIKLRAHAALVIETADVRGFSHPVDGRGRQCHWRRGTGPSLQLSSRF